MAKQAHILVKFGQLEHIQALQQSGTIYCNTVKYFATLEDGKFRGDPLESAISLKHFKKPVVKIRKANDPDMDWLNLNVSKAKLIASDPSPKGNIFCMSAFEFSVGEDSSVYTIDERCKKFGSHYLLIYNIPEFIKRIEKRLTELMVEFFHGTIEYKNFEEYSGEKHLFQKSNEYSFQEEFRLYLHTDGIKPYTFNIGSIEDISIIYNFENTKAFEVRLGI